MTPMSFFKRKVGVINDTKNPQPLVVQTSWTSTLTQDDLKSHSMATDNTHHDLNESHPPKHQRTSSGLSFSDDDDDEWNREFHRLTSPGVRRSSTQPHAQREARTVVAPNSGESPTETSFRNPKSKPPSELLIRHGPSDAGRKTHFQRTQSPSHHPVAANRSPVSRADRHHKGNFAGKQHRDEINEDTSPAHCRSFSMTGPPTSPMRGHRRQLSSKNVPNPLVSLESLYATLHRRFQSVGQRHYKVGQTWNLIGNVHFRCQDYDDAVDAYKEALQCKDGCEDPADSDHIAAAHSNIATVYWSTGRVNRAYSYLQKALKLRIQSETAHGRDPETSLSVAACHFQMGLALSLQHDFNEAMEALQRARRIQVKMLGKNHIEVARTIDAIGKVHLFRNELEEAMLCHQEALSMKRAIAGDQDPSVLVSLMNIGAVHRAHGNYEEATFAYMAVLSTQKSELTVCQNQGRDRQHIARLAIEAGETLQLIAELHTLRGSKPAADIAFKNAMSFYKEAGLKEDHPKMVILSLLLE